MSTKAMLRRQIAELQAQLASTYHFADASITKAGDCLMASGVMVQLTALGGRELTPAFVIRDGLSDDTIAALRRDIKRSYDLAIMLKPSK